MKIYIIEEFDGSTREWTPISFFHGHNAAIRGFFDREYAYAALENYVQQRRRVRVAVYDKYM
jgi:hypothetical protein